MRVERIGSGKSCRVTVYYRRRAWALPALLRHLDIDRGTFRHMEAKLGKNPTDKQVDEFVAVVHFKRRRSLNSSVPVYRHPEHGLFITRDIEAAHGIPYHTAGAVVRAWKRGDIDDPFDWEQYQALCNRNKKRQALGAVNSEWAGLSNKDRTRNLWKIPGPTKYERRLWK